jgi:hypothetical protein
MGKRHGKDWMSLPGAVGFSKVRYCEDHNELVQAVKLFGSKGMRFQCKEGCDLHKSQTILKQKESVQRRR